MKHTQGPWVWIEDKFRGGFSGLYSGDEPVLYPQRENDGDEGAAWFGTDEDYFGETALTEANAKLIAAAPLMYQALLNIKNCQESDLAEYCKSVDEIACSVLAEMEQTHEQH